MIIETSNDRLPVAERRPGAARSERWTLAGRYRLDERLGAGAMGEVWGGLDLWLHRAVAVKLLLGDAADPVSTALRFSHEARAMARLNHPNVVTVHDFGEHEGEPYLVMERLPGRNLADDLGTTPLDEATVCSVVRDVLAGLGAAHEAGLIHRDVKPGNILFTASGSAKLADFGIAKGAGQDLTRPGEFVGTWQYTAPELIAGQPASAQSDLYAVGVIMYFALSAQRPFAGESLIDLARSISQASPVPLATVRPDLDPALIAVVERAMHPSLDQRFTSATEMIAAIEPLRAASPVVIAEIPTDTHTDTAADTETGADTNTDTSTDTGTEANAETETDTDTGTPVGVVLPEQASPATTHRLIAGVASVVVLAMAIAAFATGGDGPFISTRADDTFGARTTIPSPQAELHGVLGLLDDAVAAAVTTPASGSGSGTGTGTPRAATDDLADRVELVRQHIEDGNLDAASAELDALRVATVELDDQGRLSEEHADAIRAAIATVDDFLEQVAASPPGPGTTMSTPPRIPVVVPAAPPATTTNSTLGESATMAPPTTLNDDDEEDDKEDKGNGRRSDD